MSTINYERLVNLGDKIRAGEATEYEKDEFINMLHKNGNITDKLYNDYNSSKGSGSNVFIDTALAIGAILLIGYIFKEIFKEKTN